MNIHMMTLTALHKKCNHWKGLRVRYIQIIHFLEIVKYEKILQQLRVMVIFLFKRYLRLFY